MSEPWWRKSTVYQIYPKSFYDTTGNGVGDLNGIIAKLDYIQKLGADVIWLTPIYKSPQNDHGYDISDYFSIDPLYGTMQDFERLLAEAHRRGIKVMMDIVVNHTSTEHPWFQEARKSKTNRYRNYYIWKDGKNSGPPNNWKSKFGGSAWEYDEKTGQYYLHLYDVTQADLNWENEELRKKLYEMMHFWFQKGVDGFRLDVINVISKDQRFPDDDGSVPPGDGRKFYTDGPRIHEFLQEMNRNVFSRYSAVTVGEMSSTTIENGIRYTNPSNQELDMIFQFHHLKVDYPDGEKWEAGKLDFYALKKILSKWQTKMQQGGGWNALFWCNHDQPRVVSRYGDDGKYRLESAKMLATVIHMMQGTPYVYQGEEIGMTDPKFSRLDAYRDVESKNMYRLMKEAGKSEKEAMAILQQRSRDNARTPMQWNEEKHAGFTKGEPWIPVAGNYDKINVERALKEKNSVFYHYQKLIELRKRYDVITTGVYEWILEEDPNIFAYLRRGKHETLLCVNNFFAEECRFVLPEESGLVGKNSEILLSNYPDSPHDFRHIQLRPYESIVYRLT